MSESFTTTAQKYISQLQLLASSMALLAIVAGIVLFVLWRRSGIPPQLTGRQSLFRVPWDWLEVLLATVLFMSVFEAVVALIPWGKNTLPSETYSLLELSAIPTILQPLTDGSYYSRLSTGIIAALGAVQTVPAELNRQVNEARSHMLVVIVMFPLILLFFFSVMRRLAGARLYQMGLHLNRWKENFTLGTLGWLVITPLCTIILLLVLLDFWETLWGRKASHPMQIVLMNDPRLTTWILVGIVTCMIAPIKEELLMRGIMQPYLMRNPLVSDLLVLLSIIWAFSLLLSPGSGPDRGMGMGPLFFVAAIAPGYYLFEKWTAAWITEPGAARGIFATSLFFAALHAAAWPQPIPLFLFSLGVGFLAYRTRSLVGPITLHAMFNMTTMISLILDSYPKFKW